MRRLWETSPQTTLGSLLRLPLRLVPRNAVVRVRSGVNRGLLWVAGSSVHGCWLGHYEQDKQEAIRRFLSPGMHVFDIGANAGFYTLASARLVGPSGHVWAFEPYAENSRNLLRHVELNALGNVTVVQAVVTSGAGISGFSIAQNNSMGGISDTSAYLVPTLSVDEFCRQRGIAAPNLMKIDVEGAELQVLEGARGALSEGRTVIFLALHGPEQERHCIAFLDAIGYRLAYLNGREALDRPLCSDEIVALPPGLDRGGAFAAAREE